MKNKKDPPSLCDLVEDSERFTHVIGLDEVGWGAIAGPLGVSAVVVPWDFKNPGFKDSKRYTTNNARIRGAEFAMENVLAHETLFSLPQDVHKFGPGKSLSYLQRKIVRRLQKKYPNSLVVIDGNKRIQGVRKADQVSLVGADALIPAVSAASIIAKVERDQYMIELGNELFPEWEFHKNKGYPTPEHLHKLKEWGPTRIHRLNVERVKQALEKRGWYEDGESTEGH